MENKDIPRLRDIPLIVITFLLVLIPWTFFRAEDAGQALYILKKIFTSFSFSDIDMFYPKRLLIIIGLVAFEWMQRRHEHPLNIGFLPPWARYIAYFAIIMAIFLFGTYNYTPFIYFQF